MTVCLCMIVKNEAHVVARAITSVRHLIDCYAIVDTGSTDHTKAVALASLEGLNGQIVDAPWDGYGPARTRSLDLASSVLNNRGFALIVDADDVWQGERPTLDCSVHAYGVWCVRPGAKWSTVRYMQPSAGIRYEGVVHERPVYENGKAPPATMLEGLAVTTPNDGATYADPNKYLVHAKLISNALVDDPTNTRYAFYLAQSYRDHGDDTKAALLYLARAAMGPGDYSEEVYISFLEAGRAFWRLARMDEAKQAFLCAHKAYPGRREALAELSRLFAVRAATLPTVGSLFVETTLDEDADAA